MFVCVITSSSSLQMSPRIESKSRQSACDNGTYPSSLILSIRNGKREKNMREDTEPQNL